MEEKMTSTFKSILFLKTIVTGIFGGLFSGSLFLMLHVFNMTQLSPNMMLRWLFQGSHWLDKWYAYLVFLFILSMISTIVALIYYLVLKKRKSWIVGALFGVVIWAIFYFVLPVLVKNVNPFIQLSSKTHISMLCLFVLYGVFTGYTISYDYEDLQEEYE